MIYNVVRLYDICCTLSRIYRKDSHLTQGWPTTFTSRVVSVVERTTAGLSFVFGILDGDGSSSIWSLFVSWPGPDTPWHSLLGLFGWTAWRRREWLVSSSPLLWQMSHCSRILCFLLNKNKSSPQSVSITCIDKNTTCKSSILVAIFQQRLRLLSAVRRDGLHRPRCGCNESSSFAYLRCFDFDLFWLIGKQLLHFFGGCLAFGMLFLRMRVESADSRKFASIFVCLPQHFFWIKVRQALSGQCLCIQLLRCF